MNSSNEQSLSGPSILVTANILGPLIGGTGPLAPSVFSVLRTIAQAAPVAVQTSVIASSVVVLTEFLAAHQSKTAAALG